MKTSLKYTAAGLILFGSAMTALAATFEDAPEVAQSVIAQLESEGYTVTEVEIEDSEIEIEAEKDGQERELVLAADSGKVLSDEMETEHDD